MKKLARLTKLKFLLYLVQNDVRDVGEQRIGPQPLENDSSRAEENRSVISRRTTLVTDLISDGFVITL